MSVFELDCANAASGGLICAHINQFYANVAGDPVMFYILREEELPAAHTIIPIPSTSGDECHRDVDATNSALAKAFKLKREWPLFQTCEDGQVRPLTADDVGRI